MPRLSKIGAAALAAFGWSSGTSVVAVTASYLVVAGGGAGGQRGNRGGGGGGAGGFRTSAGTSGGGASAEPRISLDPTKTYTVVVGAGGASVSYSGNNSSITGSSLSIASTGGGYGSTYGAGGTGGSGGGGCGAADVSNPDAGGAGTTGQGYSGGSGSVFSVGGWYSGGGGGGAGSAGANGNNSATGANGGNGVASSISGTSVTYAGGGGSSVGNYNGAGGGTGGTGGTGGGGNGGDATSNGTSGASNTGSGGGGSSANGSTPGNGGSGIVIISYAGAQQFGGGVVTSVGGNTIHTFTTSGTLSPITPLTASYLIVAGGAGGAADGGGGGGAGGLLSGSGVTIDPNSTYLVTVGAGGAGGVYPSVSVAVAGGSSSFSMVTTTAVGGGIGSQTSGGNGGSGGGGRGNNTNPGGTGTVGQGNNGGSGSSGNASGAGGGAGAVGANGSSTGGAGGIGVTSSISGVSTYYAGGGGGGNPGLGTGLGGAGGLGGGGSGNSEPGGSGTANTGGGGGGETGSATGTRAGGNGGSGVVIISYAGATQQMAGGTVTIVGGNVIHTFTSSGYLTPIKLVNNSLRFRASASAYLNRTPTTTGSTQKLTFSLWVKRGSLASYQNFGLNSSATSGRDAIRFSNNDNLEVYLNEANDAYLATTQVFRDPAAWYHIVVAVDTTQATSSNRIKIYVNGVQVTAFGTANYPSQNYNFTGWNVSGKQQNIGRSPEPAYYFDGYLTEVNFIDGQALTPSSFGLFNAYGSWSPVRYGGSYGTNGFYLPFTNNASTTTLGYDFSPNGNNWTTNNISLTAGSTYDSMTDVPTLTSATAANYAVWNPLDTSSNGTLSRANLQSTSVGVISGKASIAVSSGKWYWEVTCTGGNFSGVGSHIGIDSVTSPCVSSAGTRLGNTTTSYSYNSWNGQKLNNSVSSAYGSTYTNGDVISIALDLDNGKIWWAKNGTFQASGNPAAGTNAAYSGIAAGLYTAAVGDDTGGGIVLDLNCGQQPFVYTPPSGFVALNTYNL